MSPYLEHMSGSVTIVAMSDSHGKHREVVIPPCDILIHAGDISQFDRREHYVDFFKWFSEQPAERLVLIGGNHDTSLEDSRKQEYLLSYPQIHYLENSGVEIMGLNIWGSPVQTDFFNMAFSRKRSVREVEWAKVPENVDVLVSHCPPFGVLDKNDGDSFTGCDVLMDNIMRTRPKLCLFGHIHEAYGVKAKMLNGSPCVFANCSVVNRQRKVVNKPWVFQIKDGVVSYRSA